MSGALVSDAGAGGQYHIFTILSFVAGILGGVAPDDLENAWWSRRRKLWLPHRTLTHVLEFWLALVIWSYLCLGTSWWAAPLMGYAAGGVMHLLCDFPNPRGIVTMFGRVSLGLWNSGRCDIILTISAWVATFLMLDHLFLDGVHAMWAILQIAQLPAKS